MSRDLIKDEEFQASFEPLVDDATHQDSAVARYGSQRARQRELAAEIEALEERLEREVTAAANAARVEARAQAEREFGAAGELLQRIADEVLETLRERSQVAEEAVVQMAVAVAGKVVRREVRSDDTFVVNLVRRCLRKIVHGTAARVLLNPADYERMGKDINLLLFEEGRSRALEFTPDRRVEEGGCIVETPNFVVDGCASTQLRVAGRALNGDNL